MLDKELLLSVSRPARYIDGEFNVIKKDLSKIAVKVCLCFPDTYEIGMSHMGLRILYDILNRRDDCAAERVFSPWVDMEDRLRTYKIPLSSLESGFPVKDFDILGFSLQYELSYTNVLNILSLSGIPLRREDRNQGHPLVIAGGITCLNPEPMADFIDAFIIGEAEELIGELIEACQQCKKEDRGGLLRAISHIEGVYVPSLCRSGDDFKVRKRFVKNLDEVLDMMGWLVPYIEIVHDRLSIEIMRGCPNSCRFCQARSYFYPLRLASEEKILESICRLYPKTGYEEISLLSLSSSDHPKIDTIVASIMEKFKGKGIGISLPSIRAKSLVGELSEKFSSVRKSALTFAPEAGSQRLRNLLNKGIVIDELMTVALKAYRSGYRLLKLYFMIGLPTETDRDLEEIFTLCRRLSLLKKEVDGHPAHLNVSISNFVPKPHTPFQWQEMASRDKILEKQQYLKRLFNKSGGTIKLKIHDAGMSFLEAVLSRGDRRLCPVISDAFSAGAKFDAWNNIFNLSIWLDSFAKNSIDPNTYLCSRGYSQELAWDFIDAGVARAVLEKESSLALGEAAPAWDKVGHF